MKIITSCRVCKGKKLKIFFDLGKQPLANSLLKNPKEKENFYPLSLRFCHNCSLVQLNETISPRKLFSNYVWVTKTSATAQKFSKKFYREITKRAGKFKKGLVLEIGSNDGTYLLPFLKRGFDVLGIDPAENIVRLANKKGINTKPWFFNLKTAKKITKEKGFAKILIARNVLPHVANTQDFVEGLSICLAKDGLLAIEVHYAKIIQEELHYDSIYHEHLCYFTLKSLEVLLNSFNLYIFDITESPISGGSIIVFAEKNKYIVTKKMRDYREIEKKSKTNSFNSWKKFAQRSKLHSKKLASIIIEASKKGKVTGYGASARSSTLINFCKISSFVSEIADKNPLKHNLYTSGSHILIKNPKYVLSKKPKYVLILAWNFQDEIIRDLRGKYHYNGFCILPLPNDPQIIKI